jgi:hypothetical protein
MKESVMFSVRIAAMVFWMMVLAPALGMAQINFVKTGYYAALGDSVAAGDRALPVTNGYAYDLYTRGVFGATEQMEFGRSRP